MKNKILKAILVDVIEPQTDPEEAEKRLEELESLTATFGGITVLKVIQKKGVPEYQTYIGSGKVQEIYELAEATDADLIIVNNLLKARQVYKLDKIFSELEVKVWDRVDLILTIFSKHAKSTEAKLQIELASIRHMGPRIFNMGIELSRQAGALGVRAGQGETNTELMKRHLRTQELSILKKLEHYQKVHQGHRKRRERQNFKTAALVGYTNAGKSSLLNALTNKGAYVANELFATLSTRIGKLFIHPTTANEDGIYQPGQELLISDTIGFIQNLPPNLIQAFKSTLAETIDADLLLHVIDLADPQMFMKIEVVEDILKQLGLEDKPKIYIFNKIDLVDPELLEKHVAKDPEVIDYHKRPGGLLPAGAKTARILGWHTEDMSNKFIHPPEKPHKLLKKYQEFSPVFISAHQKENLDALIEILSNKI